MSNEFFDLDADDSEDWGEPLDLDLDLGLENIPPEFKTVDFDNSEILRSDDGLFMRIRETFADGRIEITEVLLEIGCWDGKSYGWPSSDLLAFGLKLK